MARLLELHPDRLFPADPTTRTIARALYAEIAALPIVSPHGHTDPKWFATNAAWTDATTLLLAPDHYLYRMLYSQGVDLDALAIPRRDGVPATDRRSAWRLFANHYYLFRGTPSRLWLDHVFVDVFGMDVALEPGTADRYFDAITEKLATEAFRPRALFDRFRIDFLATTEGAEADLSAHHAIRSSGWNGRVVTTYRPDGVIDVEHEAFGPAMTRFAELTGEDVWSWNGYLAAHRKRRADFRAAGATATDHGHPTAATANLSPAECEALFGRIVGGGWTPADAELFRAQMLTEMAGMSIEDGMVMQIHPGSSRNHNAGLFASHGRDKGADIPTRTDYVHALKPLLDRFGTSTALSVILFTLDESVYARELAPLAGHYPCLKLGPAWWFHDSPEGMRRFRETTTETAGFYNTVGFNDDTRAFLSIPARHDVARRVDCAFLARLVAEHRLADWEAAELAQELTSGLVRRAYRIDG
ncbi:MAG TPA: glucuronate isomerase [Sphingomonas sp.]|jgi:glucuronate isomerase|uniref:glucuronate isomerase n=1 Tax=Sphingomonas sp. TaxID=28214 RepID=UPI002ED98345